MTTGCFSMCAPRLRCAVPPSPDLPLPCVCPALRCAQCAPGLKDDTNSPPAGPTEMRRGGPYKNKGGAGSSGGAGFSGTGSNASIAGSEKGVYNPRMFNKYQGSHTFENYKHDPNKPLNHLLDTTGCKAYSIRRSGDRTPHARVPGYQGQTKVVVENVGFQETGWRQNNDRGRGHAMLTGIKNNNREEPHHMDKMVRKVVTEEDGKTKTRYYTGDNCYSKVSSSQSARVISGCSSNKHQFPPCTDEEKQNEVKKWHFWHFIKGVPPTN